MLNYIYIAYLYYHVTCMCNMLFTIFLLIKKKLVTNFFYKIVFISVSNCNSPVKKAIASCGKYFDLL